MDVGNPLASLAPSLDLKVLAALARSTRVQGVTEIALHVDASRPGVRGALERLAAHGLVEVITVGRTRGYRLNREHVLTSAILVALDAPSRIRARIREHVNGWQLEPYKVILFGSVARGEGGSESDVDLLVLYGDPSLPDQDGWSEQLLALTSAVHDWTGNDCEIVALSTGQWRSMRAAGESLVLDVERDGVVLWEAGMRDSGAA